MFYQFHGKHIEASLWKPCKRFVGFSLYGSAKDNTGTRGEETTRKKREKPTIPYSSLSITSSFSSAGTSDVDRRYSPRGASRNGAHGTSAPAHTSRMRMHMPREPTRSAWKHS